MRVVYVTYDGALDPLGSSQVLPYLLGLAARGFDMALVSFEKRERWANDALRTALQRRLEAAGVLWRPLRLALHVRQSMNGQQLSLRMNKHFA